MSDSKTSYRKLKHYKYQLVKDYKINIDIKPTQVINTKFIHLTISGLLTVKKLYAWDGPSGPTIDTKSFMRGSLVHDVLYQLMREEHIDYREYRDYADKLLQKICQDDSMPKFRAWYVYKFVNKFGERSAKPSLNQKDEIITAP